MLVGQIVQKSGSSAGNTYKGSQRAKQTSGEPENFDEDELKISNEDDLIYQHNEANDFRQLSQKSYNNETVDNTNNSSNYLTSSQRSVIFIKIKHIHT